VAEQRELWLARLGAIPGLSPVLTERPDHSRSMLEIYTPDPSKARKLVRRFGGKVRVVKAEEWIATQPAAPTRLGRDLEIIHGPSLGDGAARHRLQIPHGLAFGSGDHATTHLLLRALIAREDCRGTRVLDLGTGSGVLALTARLLGARKIVATDFDAEAVRTARENEALNFSTPLVRWQCADVTRLRAQARYDLVLANLFSGILCEAAPQIAASLAPGGQLWLSGILRSQQGEVIAAYVAWELKLARAVSRGKWVMLAWEKRG
jgi:ribosomal protein L11 methyltransferase